MKSQEGLFQATGKLIDDPMTDIHTAAQLDTLRAWFNDNLEKPDTFSRASRKRNSDRDTKGLSWFKPSATEHISRAFELTSVLEQSGYFIEVLMEKRLGYVIFEDEFQIVAEPFSDTKT